MTTIAEVGVRLIADPGALIAESGLAGREAGEAAGKGWSAGVALAAAAGLAAVVAITEKTTEWANSVYLLQKQTGLSAETITGWQFAAQKMGLAADDVSTLLSRFAVNAAKANSPIVDMGVSVKDASGAFLPMDQILNQVADRFASMPDGIQKSADAVAIFGRQGRAMIPFLDQGSAGIKEMTEEADRLGVTLTDQNVEAFHKLALAQEQLTQGLKGLGVTLSEAVVPVLLDVVDGANAAAPALKFVADNMNLILPVIEGVAVAFGVKTTLGLANAAIGFVGLGTSAAAATPAIAASGAAMQVTAGEAGELATALAGERAASSAAATGAGGLALAFGPLAIGIAGLFEKLQIQGEETDFVRGKLLAYQVTTNALASQSLPSLVAAAKAADEALHGTAGGMDAAAQSAIAAATKTGTLADKTVALQALLAAGTLTTEQYQQAIDNLNHSTSALDDAVTLLSTTTLPNLITAMQNAQAGAGATGAAFTGTAGNIEAATTSADTLGATLDALPRLTVIDVVTRFFTTGAGAGAVGDFPAGPAGNTDFSPTLGSTGNLEGTSGARDFVPPKARSAVQGLTQAQKDLAAVTKTDVTAAFNAEKTAANAVFQGIHDATVRRITDERNLKVAIAERTANDAKANLEAQKAALFTQANADAAAFAAHQVDEQKSQAEAAVRNAGIALATNTDPAQYMALAQALKDAQQALADFNREQVISGEQADAQKASDALDAANATIDPITHAPITKIDLALQQATAAADATQKRDQDAADKLLAQQQKDFGLQLDALQKHLTESKASHATTISAIQALYVKFGLDMKPLGANITLALAAGLTSEVKAAEKAAQSLAAAVNKYIVLHSPAEAGPWNTDPPSVSGQRAGEQLGDGMNTGLASTIPALEATIAHMTGLAGGGGKTANPMAGAPVTSTSAGDIWGVDGSGNSLNPYAVSMFNPNDPLSTGLYLNNNSLNPNYHPDGGYGAAYGMDTPAAGGDSYQVNVHNPVPEKASDTLHRLRVLGKTGQLPKR